MPEYEADLSGRERAHLLSIVCPPGSICWLCGEPIVFGLRRGHPLGPSMDHVVPRSLGGTWHLENLRACHFGCNAARGNRYVPPRPRKRSRNWLAGRDDA